MTPDKVSCVIPTRGNVDLAEIRASLPFDDVIVYDNSKRPDMGIYARYAAMVDAKHDVIVTQDDDLIVTCWDEILEAYEPGTLVCNYPEPWDIPWVARGAIFDYRLPFEAFTRYLSVYPGDELFTHRICDAVFGLLTDRVKVIDYGSRDLPCGFEKGRVSTSDGWYNRDRLMAQQRCTLLNGGRVPWSEAVI